jgi:hypothetical protein
MASSAMENAQQNDGGWTGREALPFRGRHGTEITESRTFDATHSSSFISRAHLAAVGQQ